MRILSRPVATLLFAVGVATCADAPTGPLKHSTAASPSNGAPGMLAFTPVFSKEAAAVFAQRATFPGLNFDHVRLVIVRPPSDTVKDTVVVFTPGAPDVPLDLTVDVRSETETFNTGIDYDNGTQRVYHGEGRVQAHAPDQPAPPPQPIVVEYVGPGSNVARLTVTPKTVSVLSPNTTTFSVSAFDAAGAPVPNVTVAWSSSDPSIATVSGDGVLTPRGRRGTVTVSAVTPRNISDAGSATILLPASGLTLVSGGGQSGKVGAALAAPAMVRVVASDGVGVPGVTVNFAAPSGGSVGSSSATTDDAGNASTTLKLGTALGPQSFVASSGAFSVAIPATATAGDPAAITAVSGGGQSDTVRHALRAPLVAKVVDAAGNPVSGATVNWSRTSGTGALAAPASVTGTDGQASIGYTLGSSVGPESVSASVGGVTAAATFALTAVAGTPSSIAAVSGDGQTGIAGALLSAPFVVKVTDDAGNPAAGVSVTWDASAGTMPTSSTTGTDGTASNLLTLARLVGTATVSASIASGRVVAFTATGKPGPVAAIKWKVQPTNVVAATTLTPAPQAVLLDANTNVVPSTSTISVTLAGGTTGATLSGTTSKAAVAGVAIFDDLKIDRAGTSYTLIAANAAVSTPATSAAFAVTAGSAASMLASGDNQTATVNTAVPIAPSVKIADANGNPIAGLSVTFTPASGSGTVAPTSAVATDANGVARLTSWTLGTAAGAQSIVASSTGLASVTIHATATSGAVAGVQWKVQPSGSVAASVITPPVQVTLVDAFNNLVAGTNSVALTLSGGASGALLSGTKTKAAVAGVATFDDLKVDRAGSGYTLVASVSGISTTFASSAFAVTAGSAASMLASGDNQTATVNTAVPIAPSVKIADANGNPIAGLSVTFTPASGSGTVAPTSAVATDANGVARLTSWTLGTAAGAQSIVASSTGLASVTIHATATSGLASKLAIVTQPAEAGTSGVALSRQPVIQVQDQFGNSVAASNVQITATPSSGSATGNVVSANSTTGVATFTALALTGTGSVTVVFASPGITSVTSTSVSLANTIPSQLLLVPSSPTVFSYVAGVTPTNAPSLKVADAGGGGVANIPVRVVFTKPVSGVPDTVQDVSLTSDINGLVSFLGSLPTTAAVYTVRATSTSVSGASVSITVSITATDAAKLAFVSQPSTMTAGSSSSVTVQVQDRFSNAVSGATNSVTLAATPSGGFTGAGPTAAVNGNATPTISFTTVGTYVLTATTTSPALTPATSANIVVSAGTTSALQVSVAPPTSVTNDAVFTAPKVQLVDASGNAVAQAGVVVTATTAIAGTSNLVPSDAPRIRPPGPGDVDWFTSFGTSRQSTLPVLYSGTSTTVTATTDANGVATFNNLKAVGLVQDFRLRFAISSPVSASVSSTNVHLNAGAPTAIAATNSSSTTVGIPISGSLTGSYPSVTVSDVSGNPVPNASTTITYAANGVCSVTNQVSVNSSGIAVLTSSSLSLTASAAGSCRVEATSSLAGSPIDFNIIVLASSGSTWLGATSTAFATATNWSGGSAPTTSAQVFIPKWVANAPTMGQNTTIGALTLESGATLDLGTQLSDTLFVHGNVNASGTISHGTIATTAAGTVSGTLPNLLDSLGTTTLSANTTTTGVRVASTLDVGANTLTINGNLTVKGVLAELSMNSSSSSVIVTGNATFDGRDPLIGTNKGSLELRGNFSQLATFDGENFEPGDSFTLKFAGTAAQTVFFNNPGTGSGQSYVTNILVTNSVGVTQTSDLVTISASSTPNQMTIQSGNTGAPARWNTGAYYLDVDALVVYRSGMLNATGGSLWTNSCSAYGPQTSITSIVGITNLTCSLNTGLTGSLDWRRGPWFVGQN